MRREYRVGFVFVRMQAVLCFAVAFFLFKSGGIQDPSSPLIVLGQFYYFFIGMFPWGIPLFFAASPAWPAVFFSPVTLSILSVLNAFLWGCFLASVIKPKNQ